MSRAPTRVLTHAPKKYWAYSWPGFLLDTCLPFDVTSQSGTFLRRAVQRTRGIGRLVSPVLRHKRLLGVSLFLVILAAAFEVSGLRGHFTLSFMRQVILQHRIGGLILFVVLFSLGNLIQIPGLIFLAAAVLTLGSLWGGIATYIAAVTSCLFTFLTIRALGGDALRLLTNRVAVRILREIDAHPIGCVALLRVLFQTAPALNCALAMSGIRLRPYFVGTLLGLPVPIALYCVFFDALATGLHVS
jgi:uncharacterized membrane protein YdjX (TVP38/TMEM64 family)